MSKIIALIAHLFVMGIAAAIVNFFALIVANVFNQDEWSTRTGLFIFLALWGSG